MCLYIKKILKWLWVYIKEGCEESGKKERSKVECQVGQ